MAKRRNKVWDTVDSVAERLGLPKAVFRAFIDIESTGRPTAKTGKHHGLGMLTRAEFKKFGKGNIYDPEDNALATGRILRRNMDFYKKKFGLDPTASDLYLMHQQGRGGYTEHISAPGRPAWENMYATAEGRKKGKAWAKQAIWGNLPPAQKKKYGRVENVTSEQFLGYWQNTVTRRIGDFRTTVEPINGSSMPAPERAQRYGPGNGGSTSRPIEQQLPRTTRMHEGNEPQSKSQARLTEADWAATEEPVVADPTRSPGYRPPTPTRRPTGFDEALTDRTFGEPFGKLFQNEATSGMPGPIPLLKDLLTPKVDPAEPAPVKDEVWKKPMGRQLLQRIFNF